MGVTWKKIGEIVWDLIFDSIFKAIWKAIKVTFFAIIDYVFWCVMFAFFLVSGLCRFIFGNGIKSATKKLLFLGIGIFGIIWYVPIVAWIILGLTILSILFFAITQTIRHFKEYDVANRSPFTGKKKGESDAVKDPHLKAKVLLDYELCTNTFFGNLSIDDARIKYIKLMEKYNIDSKNEEEAKVARLIMEEFNRKLSS